MFLFDDDPATHWARPSGHLPWLIEHADGAALARAVAWRLAATLRRAIVERGRATLALTGGDAALDTYAFLAAQELDWRRVTLLLTDEPWLPPTDPRSHERRVADVFLGGAAGAASLLPYLRGSDSVGGDLQAAALDVARLPRPYDAVVLDVGEDGRIAGMAPDVDGLGLLLDPTTPATLAAVDRADPGGQMLTLTVAALIATGVVLVVGRGAAEATVLGRAYEAGPPEELPLRAVFDNAPEPVEVHWCP
ncbi:MAG: 6-phosphogluconolactonase [Pseudomonadota bacterium]